MRTKALILSAMLGVAGLTSAIAQNNVYSVNVVGYMTLTFPQGFSLVADQLDNGANNLVTNLLAGITLPNNFRVYKFNGTSYDTLTWAAAPFNRWNPATQHGMTMKPGEGVFIQNPSATAVTATFVGEVMQSKGVPLVNPVVAGFDIYSAMVPQQGGITSVHAYPPENNDAVYKFNVSLQRYDSPFTYRGAPFNRWTPSEPVLNVGEAIFLKATSAKNWSRTFDVQ